jgi:hypothetical protein
MQEVLHSYYIAPTGRLFGLIPGKGGEVVCISHPVSFDARTRILSYLPPGGGPLKQVLLPLDKAEQSKTPNLCERTKVMLSQLATGASVATKTH